MTKPLVRTSKRKELWRDPVDCAWATWYEVDNPQAVTIDGIWWVSATDRYTLDVEHGVRATRSDDER